MPLRYHRTALFSNPLLECASRMLKRIQRDLIQKLNHFSILLLRTLQPPYEDPHMGLWAVITIALWDNSSIPLNSSPVSMSHGPLAGIYIIIYIIY